MMKKIFMTVLVAAVAVGCSKQDVMDTPQEPGTIRLFMGVEAPASKTVVTPVTGATAVQFLKINAAAAPADFSGAVADKKSGNIAGGSGEVTFDSKFSYDKGGDAAWMLAYYPAGTLAESVVTWPIDGQTDAMRTEAVWNAGTYAAPLTGATGTKMELKHCLSRVEVKCEAESGSDIKTVQAAWGNIIKIELLATPKSVSYDLGSLTVTSSTDKIDLPLLKDYVGGAFTSIAMPTNGSQVINAMAMVVPVAVDNGVSFKLRITTAGAVGTPTTPIVTTVDVKLTNPTTPTAMERAKIHQVNLTFKADGKNIEIKNTTIEDWATGSTASNDLNKPTA